MSRTRSKSESSRRNKFTKSESSRRNKNTKSSSNFLTKSALERVTAEYAKQAAEAKAKARAKQEAEWADWAAERKQGIKGLMLGIHNAQKQALNPR